MQAKMMWIMPLGFSFCSFFPAGLVLYWLPNNLLSIAQQWMINKQLRGSKLKALVTKSCWSGVFFHSGNEQAPESRPIVPSTGAGSCLTARSSPNTDL